MIEDFLQREALVLECTISPSCIDSEDLVVFERDCKNGKKSILYNKKLPFGEARIAAAKALAYHTWHQTEDHFFITKDTVLSKAEMNGVYELLMPEHYVESFARQLAVPTTFALTNMFGVTDDFVKERLSHMKYTGLIAGYNY